MAADAAPSIWSAAYFTVELEPGRYAWISEGPDVRRMVREFTVPR